MICLFWLGGAVASGAVCVVGCEDRDDGQTAAGKTHAPATTRAEESYGFSPEELKALGLDDIDMAADDPDESGTAEGNPMAGCLQCHVDVESAHKGGKHYQVGKIRCIDCHGPSIDHVGDENNEVKPDELFARGDVDSLCGKCHGCSRAIPSGPAKLPLNKPRVCTDCHPAHEFTLPDDD